MRIYLAGPIGGLTPPQVFDHFESLAAKLRPYYEVLHPMLGKGHFRQSPATFVTEGYTHPVSNNHSITRRDLWCVQQANIVLADFSRTPDAVTIGTCIELGWGYAFHKHTLAVLDLSVPNVHQHAFILECADIVWPTMAQAVAYLIQLAGEPAPSPLEVP